jgi:hypothetical protein
MLVLFDSDKFRNFDLNFNFNPFNCKLYFYTHYNFSNYDKNNKISYKKNNFIYFIHK